jgi:osmotically-inducible protein OsmY
MSTASLTDTDVQLRDAVQRQLEWDPEVDAAGIGVAASGGAVTLTGWIDSYAGKRAAERAAMRVRGVRAVANDIVVRLASNRTDSDIAADVTQALRLRQSVPSTVQAAIRDGVVTLTGSVTRLHQKREAEKAVRQIRGVRDVADRMMVTSAPVVTDVRHRIVQALHQNANLDAREIAVSIAGEKAVLSGQVGTWLQREIAERAAADAPGITTVENRIEIVPRSVPDDEGC